jgi:lipoprotein signal peptidase
VELLGAEAEQYRKMSDTLDVWFDSGATHSSVLRGSHRNELAYPADLYLEGSDQHRGWFQSSLLIGCAMDGPAPYKALLTHGFVVDGKGLKMSKSKGNVIAPQKIADTLGAEILRLWVAATDYSGELSISDEILKRVVEAYRRIRNTLRFLLANTSDFDPARDLLEVEQWLEIDRYALAMTRQLQAQCEADYERFEFHRVVQSLQTFCSEDLGGFYLDILKDRLYTTAAGFAARRSAQSALWHILQCLTKLMAPILCFTAEEIWQLQSGDRRTVDHAAHLAAAAGPGRRRRTARKWQDPRLPGAVMRALEELRSEGRIGSSLQAAVKIHCDGEKHDLLASLGDDLRFVFICSQATVFATPASSCSVHRADARQVRALLARARRRRGKPRAPGPLRPLHRQPVRRRRKPVPSRNIDRWLWLAGIIVVLDQVSKWLILAWLQPGDVRSTSPLLQLGADLQPRRRFQLPLRRRRLAALVLHRPGARRFGWIVSILPRHSGEFRLSLALTLILGGALGNVIDRLRFGAVIDFIQWHAAGFYWPAFNIADSAICIGAVLMAWDQFAASPAEPASDRARGKSRAAAIENRTGMTAMPPGLSKTDPATVRPTAILTCTTASPTSTAASTSAPSACLAGDPADG